MNELIELYLKGEIIPERLAAIYPEYAEKLNEQTRHRRSLVYLITEIRKNLDYLLQSL